MLQWVSRPQNWCSLGTEEALRALFTLRRHRVRCFLSSRKCSTVVGRCGGDDKQTTRECHCRASLGELTIFRQPGFLWNFVKPRIKRHPLLMNRHLDWFGRYPAPILSLIHPNSKNMTKEAQEGPPFPTAVWMDLAPFATWVYMGLSWFHLPYNWAAHSCRAIHPCRLPTASHSVQLVEFLAVPTWCVCCQIMERPEDFLKERMKRDFLIGQPSIYLDDSQITWLGQQIWSSFHNG